MTEQQKPKAKPKPKNTSGIRSVNIPKEVREDLRTEARAQGMSTSALSREIMNDYISGKLKVPPIPGPDLVSTSIWVDPETWAKFTAKCEKQGFPSQWVFRTWLAKRRPAA